MAEVLVVATKLGILGSEPVGLYDTVADHLDADHHNPIDVHDDFYLGQDRNKTNVLVHEIMLARATESLAEGKSVVYDAFMNNPNRLAQLVAVANSAGALLLPIHIKTRVQDCQKNLSRRFKRDELEVPASETTYIEQAKIARDMHKYLLLDGIHPDFNGTQHLCFSPDATISDVITRLDKVLSAVDNQ